MLGFGLLRRDMTPGTHAAGLKNLVGKQENRSVQSGG
jgi:hypothetical protein